MGGDTTAIIEICGLILGGGSIVGVIVALLGCRDCLCQQYGTCKYKKQSLKKE